MQSAKKAILHTLIYSDLFDFPLTEEEIWYFLKTSPRIAYKLFSDTLATMAVGKKKRYYYLSGREIIVDQRLAREVDSKRKQDIAKRTAFWLSLLPTVQYIGISGSVAMHNATPADDIDLFIIVERNTLWTSRFIIVVLLELLRVRRRKNMQTCENRICVNMIIDNGALTFEEERHDVYTAHEIAQLRTLFDRNKTFEKFINANQWITGFMPNIVPRHTGIQKGQRDGLAITVFIIKNLGVEPIMKAIQLFFIQRSRTIETISDTLVAFHPFDYRRSILSRYKKMQKR